MFYLDSEKNWEYDVIWITFPVSVLCETDIQSAPGSLWTDDLSLKVFCESLGIDGARPSSLPTEIIVIVSAQWML